MTQSLIIIQGLPGTGKSTLATKLAKDLGIALLGKDMVKEFLFDAVGVNDRDDSRLIGKVAARSLFVFADEYLGAGRSVIIESAFHVDYARQDVRALLEGRDVQTIELFCKTEQNVRQKRVIDRAVSGARHPGHFDKQEPAVMNESVYEALRIGKTVEVDTTKFDENDYLSLLKLLRSELDMLKA